jgi:hypothetical protein
VLHLSEHAAYGRIEAARAARRFPVILKLLTEGSVTLTTVCLLARHLTPTNHREVLDAARNKSKRDVEHLIARLQPRPPVPSTIRKLPEPKRVEPPSAGANTGAPLLAPPASSAPSGRCSAACPAVVRPVAPERYKVQFTVGAGTHAKLRRAQDLLRHTIPNGDPAAIFDRALTLLLAELEKTKLAATTRSAREAGRQRGAAGASALAEPAGTGQLEVAASNRPAREDRDARRSRHIPAAVKRAVWARDEGRCAFMGSAGRCTERGFLEFHHVVPYAAGGEATVENIQVRCRRHNAYEAEQYFGPLFVRESGACYGIDSVQTEFGNNVYRRAGPG